MQSKVLAVRSEGKSYDRGFIASGKFQFISSQFPGFFRRRSTILKMVILMVVVPLVVIKSLSIIFGVSMYLIYDSLLVSFCATADPDYNKNTLPYRLLI